MDWPFAFVKGELLFHLRIYAMSMFLSFIRAGYGMIWSYGSRLIICVFRGVLRTIFFLLIVFNRRSISSICPAKSSRSSAGMSVPSKLAGPSSPFLNFCIIAFRSLAMSFSSFRESPEFPCVSIVPFGLSEL